MPTHRRATLALISMITCSGDVKPEASTEPARTCGTDRHLNGGGVGDFRIDMTVQDVRAKCDVVLDTTLQSGNEGQPERRLSVRVDVDTLQATVADGRVWRIEVRSPRLKTPDSIGVGSTVRDLMKQPVDWFGYGEGGPFVGLRKHCGLSLHLADISGFPRSLEQVPQSATVDLILIVGCQPHQRASAQSPCAC